MDIERLKEMKEVLNHSIFYFGRKSGKTEFADTWFDVMELIDEAIARQSATSEDVAEAIEQVEGTRRKAQKELDSLIETKSRYDHQIEIGDPWNWKWEESWHPLAVEGHKQTIKNANLAITALQAYQPWIPVSESIPIERDLQNGMVLAWSTELREWQVENWGYVEDRPDDYTHWKPLPEPPKGETL